MLSIDVSPEFEPYLDTEYLEQLAAAVLTGEGIAGPTELNLLITDDEGIRAINRQYRGIDAPTDVLSFSALPSSGEDMFVMPPDGILRLGDIVISFERAREQATEFGHSVRQEVGELFVHGLLHILGYDHENETDAAVMAEKAQAYMR